MSLLWANQVLVGLSATNVAVLNRHRGLRPRVVDQQHVSFSQQTNDASWHHAANQLDGLLAAMLVKPRTQLQVILASDLVRYLTLPPQQVVLMSSSERQAYAEASCREVYGAVVDGWEIIAQDTPAHLATIVAAVDKALLETLKEIALKYQLKLVSIQPYLMSVYHCLYSQISKKEAYLVIVELGRMLLVSLQKGHCQNVRSYVVGDHWPAELRSLLVREALVSGEHHLEVLVYAPAHKNLVLKDIEGWQIKRIGQLKNIVNHVDFAILEAVA